MVFVCDMRRWYDRLLSNYLNEHLSICNWLSSRIRLTVGGWTLNNEYNDKAATEKQWQKSEHLGHVCTAYAAKWKKAKTKRAKPGTKYKRNKTSIRFFVDKQMPEVLILYLFGSVCSQKVKVCKIFVVGSIPDVNQKISENCISFASKKFGMIFRKNQAKILYATVETRVWVVLL